MLPPINVMYVKRLFNTSQSVKTNYLRMIYKYSNNKLNCVRTFYSVRSSRNANLRSYVYLFVQFKLEFSIFIFLAQIFKVLP